MTSSGWLQGQIQPRVLEEPAVVETDQIPTLDTLEETSTNTKIAAPPNIKINRYKTIIEIDKELSKDEETQSSIDLGLLTSNLIPPEQRKEDFEEEWGWEKTINSIKTEIK